jgi:hypothetical protein
MIMATTNATPSTTARRFRLDADEWKGSDIDETAGFGLRGSSLGQRTAGRHPTRSRPDVQLK